MILLNKQEFIWLQLLYDIYVPGFFQHCIEQFIHDGSSVTLFIAFTTRSFLGAGNKPDAVGAPDTTDNKGRRCVAQ
jgi:hypothetical protein